MNNKSSNTSTPIRTHGLFVQDQHDDTGHTFNEHKRTVARRCQCSVFGQHARQGEITILYCIEHTWQLQIQANSHQYKRTVCPSRANMTPFHNTFNEHKRIIYNSRHRHFSVFGQHIRVRLQFHSLLHRERTIKASNTSTPIRTHGLFVQDQHDDTVTYI